RPPCAHLRLAGLHQHRLGPRQSLLQRLAPDGAPATQPNAVVGDRRDRRSHRAGACLGAGEPPLRVRSAPRRRPRDLRRCWDYDAGRPRSSEADLAAPFPRIIYYHYVSKRVAEMSRRPNRNTSAKLSDKPDKSKQGFLHFVAGEPETAFSL